MDLSNRHGPRTGCLMFRPTICGVPVEKHFQAGHQSIRMCRNLKGRILLQLAQHRAASRLVRWASGNGPWTQELERFAVCLNEEVFPACGIELVEAGRPGAHMLRFVIGLAKDFHDIWDADEDDGKPTHEILCVSQSTFDQWLKEPWRAYVVFVTHKSWPAESSRAFNDPLPFRLASRDSKGAVPAGPGGRGAPPPGSLTAGMAPSRTDQVDYRTEYHTEPTPEELRAARIYAVEAYEAMKKAESHCLPEDFTKEPPPWVEQHLRRQERDTWEREHGRCNRVADRVRALLAEQRNLTAARKGLPEQKESEAVEKRLLFDYHMAVLDLGISGRNMKATKKVAEADMK
ncbi:hypothetical protein NLU13_2403 [Sarocladium strictum]|uniref:Uncharacterized protein n=1 Tax=Sarocladium strictum TaxID=5046 RepID=A0AA39GTI8_SARSR|nr:hypothetical protein NLU13_2403 [Sarocladium strictum]